MTSLPIALCSWSVDRHGALRTPEVLDILRQVGIDRVHLNLNPMLDHPAEVDLRLREWRDSGVTFSAAMVGFQGEDYTSHASIHQTGGYVPEAWFEERFARTVAAGELCQKLGIGLLTTHAGFIPSRNDTKAFGVMVDRLRRVADALQNLRITLGFETGQETATTLADFLTELKRSNVVVNFDPANMLLYGKGDPVEAVGVLAPWIRHVHAKDARRRVPGPSGWEGDEVPLGQGDAKLAEVIGKLKENGYAGTVAIEREAGGDRIADTLTGIAFLRRVST